MSTVIGVDLGIRKIAWSLWKDDILVKTGAFESGHGMRQHQLHDIAGYIAYHVREEKPDSVWIEDTLIGNNRKYSIALSQTMGAVLSHLSHKNIYLVNVSTWKKKVVGSGNAAKNTVQNYMWQRDSAYAELCARDQDRFDAACIGWYGVLIERQVAEGMGRVSSGDSTDS